MGGQFGVALVQIGLVGHRIETEPVLPRAQYDLGDALPS